MLHERTPVLEYLDSSFFIVPLERVHRLIAPSDLTEFLNQADWEIWPAQKEIDDWLARIMTLVFVCRSGTVKKRNPGDL
ncbi:MAG: hypothetical protein O9320_13075 [Magnetospirillum sp.]|nr:hypothetical protein [Magnetospirillum sp.]